MNSSYVKLTKYVNSAGALGDLLAKKVKDGEITDPRIVDALVKFRKAEQDAALLHEIMANIDTKLN